MAAIAVMESLSERGLRETRTAMGENASLLQHLPVDKVRHARFEDKKRERPNSFPMRILFGQLREGDKKGHQVWILLNKPHHEDRSPEQRFNIFDSQGCLLGGITADDAVRQSNLANAFKCLKTSGTIDMTQLRAVIKYYFMLKKLDPLLPWPVDARFISCLTAACKVARNTAMASAMSKQKRTDRMSMPSNISQQATKTKTLANESRAGTPTNGPRANKTLASTKAQSVPYRSAIRSASSQPNPSLRSEDSDGLFVSERPRRAVTPLSFKFNTPGTAATAPPSELEPIEEFRRSFQMSMLPKPALKPPTPPPNSPRSNRNSFSIHQDTSPVSPAAGSSPANPVPKKDTANTALTINAPPQQKDKSPNEQSPLSFISAYRKADAESELCETKLQQTDAKIRETKAELAVLETRLRELQVEERRLKAKHRGAQTSKKRLHDELGPEERELLRFGAEMAERELKRPKVKAHEHAEGDGLRVVLGLGWDQKGIGGLG